MAGWATICVLAAVHTRPAPPALSSTVFSLATVDAVSGERNMNIVTYAMPVSLPQSNVWAVSMFRGTVSARAMIGRRRGMLQILGERHADLVPLFGKSSRRDVDKLAAATQMGHRFVHVSEARQDLSSSVEVAQAEVVVAILEDCVGYLDLAVEAIHPAGDHDLCLCTLLAYTPMAGAARGDAPLTTSFLRENGLLPAAGQLD
ncbi:hypothetical protein KFE25_005835 [Diacronema lutheri]|uniref:Flavin reductase like domain-containing protein n=1 Tax=Diacronema lutheri TaxID=2081491 RepID=A0A8J5XWS0_DIALT|nr:hypothetical protein KFE25_005835 [Diacronema lutheri]